MGIKKDYMPATLMALFTSYIDLADAAVTARASWLLAVQKEQAARATIVAALGSRRRLAAVEPVTK